MIKKYFVLLFIVFLSVTACTTNNSTPTSEEDTSNLETINNENDSNVTTYSIAEISLNNNSDSCWTYMDNNVYDITDEIQKHPGGSENILKICGKNGEALFNQNHQGQPLPNNLLNNYLIGSLEN